MESSPNNNPPSAAIAAAAFTLSPRASSSFSSPSSPPPPGRPVSGTGSPPWTQIVRGPESDPVGSPADISLAENPPENADNSGGNGNADGSKKPAWNKKPSNGSVDNSGPVVMGAASWPALSESTKFSPKPSPSDCSKNPPDSGSPAPAPSIQVTGLASSSSSPLPSPSKSSLTSQKPTTTNANQHPTSNQGRLARQKSMKRDGGGNAQANGGFSHHPSPHGEGSNNHSSSVKLSSSGGNESSGRDNSQNHANRESGPRNTVGDHHQLRNSFRRTNSGPHSRGDGSHQNYGGRRGDQDRGNHDWTHSRSFNGRDAPPMQPRVGPRGFVRTPPVSAPYVHPGGPAPMRPFMNPMGVPDMPMIYFRPGVPFVAPVQPPMFFPVPDPQLLAKIVNQIDYYFSNENLVKDTFLRRNMDQNGWVPVSLIASFKKVMQLTDNMQLILEALRSSSVLEAQGDKIRRRDDWMRWIMPPSMQFPYASSLQSPESPSTAALSADIQSLSLNERTADVKAEVLLRSSTGNLSGPLHTNNDVATSSGC